MAVTDADIFEDYFTTNEKVRRGFLYYQSILMGESPMRLEGNRITLREYRKDDFNHIRSWVGDPEVVNNLSDIFLQPQTQNSTEKYLNHVLELDSTNEFHFVIEEKSKKEYIGQIDIIKVDWKNRVAELGVVIGLKENRGQGYGHEAIKLLQDFF